MTGSNDPYQQDPGVDGIVSIEAENIDLNISQGAHDWVLQDVPAGYSGSGAMLASPNIGTNNNTGYVANSPRLDFVVNFVQTGIHYVWIRGIGNTPADDSVHVGLDGIGLTTSDKLSGFNSNWTWSKDTMDGPVATVNVTTTGVHTVNVWMREDGFIVDKLVLTVSSGYIPTGSGPAESPRGNSLVFIPDVLTFTVEEGGTTPSQTTDLDTSDSSVASYTITDDVAWLTVTPTSGSTLDTLIVSINASGLSLGTYTGTITATAGGYADDTIEVTLTVTNGIIINDDFNDGNADGWTPFDDSGKTSDWRVINNSYHQNNPFSGSTFVESYHLGKYSLLESTSSLADYRVTVEITPIDKKGNDVGLMFRYQDNDNYYRLSLNSRYGFTRLEKKLNGTFSPLKTNSRGYIVGQPYNIFVELRGSVILVYLDNDPLFSIIDSSISSGGVALYCQGETEFDNILIESNSSEPAVVISSPGAYSVNITDTLDVLAILSNVPLNGKVEFVLDDMTSTSVIDSTFPYTAQFTGVLQGEHKLDAILRDESNTEMARDTNEGIGVLGANYAAVGDSITNGIDDNFKSDNISQNGKIISIQGFESNLTDLLTNTFNYPVIVFNEGIPGDESYHAAYERIDSIQLRNPNANIVPVLLGTNDSSDVPSGWGCSGSGCAGTYMENMQLLINRILADGKQPVIALVLPVFGETISGPPYSDPLIGSRNLLIQEYNWVIAGDGVNLPMLTGHQIGPDFFYHFLGSGVNRSNLFSDNVHPNALGTVVIAYLWHNLFTGSSDFPFTLDNLIPSNYKQNLLEKGNKYLLDRDYILESIPLELKGNDIVWIMPKNDDKNNTSTSYLQFDISQSSTVYVAYDSRATSLPKWLSDNFNPTALQIGVTDQMGHFDVYSNDFSQGTVVLGGNKASPAEGVGTNYIVIVKKN